MALLVPCPRCGPRPVDEFIHAEMPRVPEGLTDPDLADLDRVFMRDNPSGPALEAWFHQAGCRRWAHLERDRTTDQWL